jgi:hypothetical protein
MASATKTDVQNAGLPIKDIFDRLDPKRHSGHKTAFFRHVVRYGKKEAGVIVTDAEVDSLAGNLAHKFTQYANGQIDTFPLGTHITLAHIGHIWNLVSTGNLDLDKNDAKTANGSKPAANGNGTTPTGTEVRRAEEAAAVPPVSQNVFASAMNVFDLTRTDKIAPPTSVDDAYEVLWDHLAEPVRSGRASGVISDTLLRLASDKVAFAGLITVLPDDIKTALTEVLIDRHYDTYKTSLKDTVENVYHISIGMRHALPMFTNWAASVKQAAEWAGRNAEMGWVPSEDDIKAAAKDHAVATFRALATGLRTEVVASNPEPQVVTVEEPAIQFNTVLPRLLAKGPEIMGEIGGKWGNMTNAQRRAVIEDLDKEDAAMAAAPETPAPKVEAPKTETKKS